MKLGFFIQPVHPITRNYREVLDEDREAIILADRLGYEEALLGEHYTDLAEPITSSLMFFASLARDAPRIKLGSAVINLPSYHPATIAGQVAMLDHLLDGRYIFGIGPGGVRSDIEMFGNLDLDRNAKMVEAFDHILALWTGDAPYELKGEFYETTTARSLLPEIGMGIAPKPLQQPHPPVIVTALAPNSHGITLAAERGWTPISSNYVQARLVKTHLPKFLEGLRNSGRPEDPSGWRVAKSIFVADDENTARDYAKSVDGSYGHYFHSIITKLTQGRRYDLFKSSPDQADNEVSVAHSLETQVIAGTVNSVVDQILAFREETGPFGTLVYTGHDWRDAMLGKRSMQLMAEEVMPRVNTALGE
ncbi:MAG: LLM class flavin-dependent oxidoreductase [Rhodospirillales bacterium]|nr:LLM class flavin-dependent oxidoreductase [Rhodospirillales bacterium]